MDNCIDCKIERIKKYLLCVDCDEKLKIKNNIQKKIRDNWNWPFDRNDILSKQQIRNHN